jgi:hypothetical protein
MDTTLCHAAGEIDPSPVRTLILKTFGVKRVADWCGVDEQTPYQWLKRGSAVAPIPPVYVPKIIAGAKAANIAFDPSVLWPEMRGLL